MIIQEQEYLMHDAFLEHYGVVGMKWGHRKRLSILDRYKKNKKTEKQYNEDLSLYGKKGAKRIADDMDNKNTLKGARSREASKYNSAVKAVRKAGTRGTKIGMYGGYALGLGTILAGYGLTNKILNNNGRLNALGEFINTNPLATAHILGTTGAIVRF